MKYKQYTEEEFNKFCEDNFIEDNFGIWELIKDQKVNLKADVEVLTIKIKLIES